MGGLTSRTAPAIKKISILINAQSGSVGPSTEEEARALTERLGLEAQIESASGADLDAALVRAVQSKPDLLAVIAGDGTARAAAALCGPKGPLLAPLPGGTMNMLPKAFYGPRDWKTALTESLEDGVERQVSGGEIDGRMFFVAAILGAPALWASAREAARERRPLLAFNRARRALAAAFTGSLRYSLDGKRPEHAEALTLLCPLISTEVDEAERALEAAALDPAGAAEVFRLAFHALYDNWRRDPAVRVELIRKAEASARGRIPAVLDGEPMRLPSRVKIRFVPSAFRVLTPRAMAPEAK